jgi:O-acetyl-ADP-ribose deacetylase (regulator of RNase III)
MEGKIAKMEIILTSMDAMLAEAWEYYCEDLQGVSFYRGSILEVECDAVVSPANSFGFMDGGIDMAYSLHFGWDVQERLQTIIREKYHGELLVGQAEIVPTEDKAIPYLIAAPTMRVPMVLSAASVNPYLAARAVLLLVKYGIFEQGPLQGQPIAQTVQRVAFPGLGTGVGQIDPKICAIQVRQAIEEIVFGQTKFPKSWVQAVRSHQLLQDRQTRELN